MPFIAKLNRLRFYFENQQEQDRPDAENKANNLSVLLYVYNRSLVLPLMTKTIEMTKSVYVWPQSVNRAT